jgi:hypothetical protein
MLARGLPIALALALLAGCGGHGTCGGGASAKLSVLAERDSHIGATFALAGAHPGAPWRVVVVHEGHVVWRGAARAGRDGALKVHRRLDDYRGVDHVTVRAYGADGATCAATAQT